MDTSPDHLAEPPILYVENPIVRFNHLAIWRGTSFLYELAYSRKLHLMQYFGLRKTLNETPHAFNHVYRGCKSYTIRAVRLQDDIRGFLGGRHFAKRPACDKYLPNPLRRSVQCAKSVSMRYLSVGRMIYHVLAYHLPIPFPRPTGWLNTPHPQSKDSNHITINWIFDKLVFAI